MQLLVMAVVLLAVLLAGIAGLFLVGGIFLVYLASNVFLLVLGILITPAMCCGCARFT